jgi:cob(I)alamin adenosyltransferase
MPASVDSLKVHLGLTGARADDEAAMADAVDAANDWVSAVRADLPTEPEAVWPARVDKAAVIQAARLYGRRGSTTGVAAFQDTGVTLLARLDPDVRLLLEIGEYQTSVTA